MIGPLTATSCTEGHVHTAVDVELPLVVVIVAGRPTCEVTMHWSTALTSATNLVRAAREAAWAVVEAETNPTDNQQPDDGDDND